MTKYFLMCYENIFKLSLKQYANIKKGGRTVLVPESTGAFGKTLTKMMKKCVKLLMVKLPST